MTVSKAKPLLRWMGGKSKLASLIISQLPKHICYVEPFCGGAAVFLKKPRTKVEVINDGNGELINLYRCIKNHPEELMRQSVDMLHSRWLFDRLNNQNPQDLTDIQRVARFYALNRMAFGGRMYHPSFGYGRTTAAELGAKRFKQDVELVSARLNQVYIENLDWADCVLRYDSDNTLVYCDPPYYQTTGYGVEFGLEQYVKMADMAREMKGKMLISVNDCEAMREVFAGFAMEQLTISYMAGKVAIGGKRGYQLKTGHRVTSTS